MKISNIFTISVFFLILSVITINGQDAISKSETIEDLLKREIILPHLINEKSSLFFQSDGDAFYLFQLSVSIAKLPGGVILSNCEQSKSKHFELPNKTSIGNVLTLIEANDSNYRWEFKDEVLNLVSKNDSSKLINMPIKQFKTENLTANETLNFLLNKPEVKEKIIEFGLSDAVYRIHRKGVYIPESEKQSIPRFNFDIQDTTIREILNEIVRSQAKNSWKYQDSPFWIFTERHCGKQNELTIYLGE